MFREHWFRDMPLGVKAFALLWCIGIACEAYVSLWLLLFAH